MCKRGICNNSQTSVFIWTFITIWLELSTSASMKNIEIVDFSALSVSQVAREVGRRLRAERIRRGMSQVEMAAQAGLSARTYRRLEAEGVGTVQALLAVLRICDRLRALQVFLPQASLPEVRTPLSEKTLPRVRRSISG